MKTVIETKRLKLKELTDQDGLFIHSLFNDPDCLRFIGDRGIGSLADAQCYLKDKLIHSYQEQGYGLFRVSLYNNKEPLGICGLVKRDKENPPDIGFAFLPQYRSGGYCTEAAQAVLDWARGREISKTVLAYTNPDNFASIRVLEKIGLKKQSITTLPGQDTQSLVLSIKLS